HNRWALPMTTFKFQEKKRRIKIFIALGVLTAAMLGLSVWLTGPSPPRKIVLATGQEGGGYDAFGQQYRAGLGKMGLEVELVNTTLTAGRRPTIAVGPEASGTEAVGKLLLQAHGITPENARLVNLDTAEARQGLKDGSVDVALIISSYRDPAIPDLLARKDV